MASGLVPVPTAGLHLPDIFLSYSREDQATASRFADGLERAGFSVWWDQALRSGEAYDEVTEKALQDAKAVVVLWSRKSVASRWVRAEATQASRNKSLVPVMIEPCTRPIMFELTHTADLAHWKGDPHDKAWQIYLADLHQLVTEATPARAPDVVSAPTTAAHDRRRGGRTIAVAVAALLVAGAGLWVLNRQGDGKAVTTSDAAAPVTLAVLPFVNLSSDPEQEYFSDGLSEEILNQLAQVRNLAVIARTSSFSFKDRNEDMRVIGEKLGVANLLEGSVRKDGTQLRITTQLINGRSGAHLWSRTYDRELKDVFALQEEVAKDVAKALSIKLDVGDLPRIQGGTTNVEAYDRYLQGRKLYLQSGPLAARQAVPQLRAAVTLDPRFSRAWLMLSSALSGALIGLPEAEAAVIRAEAAAATDRVMELAPDAGWVQAVRARQLVDRFQWAQAEAALAAAQSADAAHSADYAVDSSKLGFLLSTGRILEAMPLLEQAQQLDPLSLGVSHDLQWWLDVVGRPVEAQDEYERSRELVGIQQRGNVYAVLRLLARKDADQADLRARFDRLLKEERLPMQISHELAGTFDVPVKAREAIRLAIDDPANQDDVRMTVIALYADRFDERDMALIALRRATIDFRGGVTGLWYPYVSGLRADRRFKDLLREVGLADYFRSSGNWGDFCKPVGTGDFECH
jgi:TolB-like protein